MRQHYQILELNNFQFNIDTDIVLLNHTLKGENVIRIPHIHNFYMFFLVVNSSGTHTIDFVEYKVGNHQLHILLPNQVHHWSLTDGTTGYQLMISKKVFQTFSRYLNFSPLLFYQKPIVHLDDVVFQQLLYEYQQIEEEYKSEIIYTDIVYLRCKIITQIVARVLQPKSNSVNEVKDHPVIFHYTELVDKYFKEQKSVRFYAGKLNITPNYLNILTKKNTPFTATQIIQNRTILEAKRLLEISKMSIKEIAYELGFSDLAYFSNFFKKMTNASPKAFREKL